MPRSDAVAAGDAAGLGLLARDGAVGCKKQEVEREDSTRINALMRIVFVQVGHLTPSTSRDRCSFSGSSLRKLRPAPSRVCNVE